MPLLHPRRTAQDTRRKGYRLNALKALMYVTFVEALSWMALLVAMIAKYGFDNPTGVSIMGPIHGTLFLLFAGLLVLTHVQERWPLRKTLLAFLESIPPFTGFLLARQLRDEVASQSAPASPAI